MDIFQSKKPKIGIRSDPMGTVVIWSFLFAALVLTFYPFFYILSLAVMPYENYLRSPVHFGPDGFTLQYFIQIWRDPFLPRSFLLSIARVLVGTTLNVLLTTMAAYAVSNNGIPQRRFFAVFFMIPMFFSPGVIPYYLTIKTAGIMNTFWALILPGLVAPMWFFVARASFNGFPGEILEAARIDGAGQFKVFWTIVWPISKPIVATLCMMYGVNHWNEYFMTRLVVQKPLWTAPVQLYNMMSSQNLLLGLGAGVRIQPQSYLSAIAACLIIPVFLAYPILQRYIISGLTAGAVKG